MNQLKGKIKSIETSGSLSLVRVEVVDILLTAIIIDTPATVDYLNIGESIKVIFKETEVIIGKGINHQISLRNKLIGKIKKIELGDLLSKIIIETPAGDITSIITSNAVRNLEFNLGDEVTAMIKTNEMMLSK